MTTATVPRLLTEAQVSEMTGLPVASLKTERCRGLGLPYVKFGRRVRYRADDVAAYIAANTITPTPTAAAAE
ncbi:helix-turn-helix transcriptional regulator [[Mycobacterium] holstebronense]|uniref:Helix-turn-helix domain-containing protein n=1 Tax=[Mycobacterium] holstebronense TaxID=3064288 RepID=A0ABM9LT75_9MYCO|nr:helix-turn-helix domain-containing protein [Mycolicibacter sp. MU0102]CAJ1504202.1 helix-turn-helix domain-containing protein [Mycolicibacter sp. MU0102]